MLVNAKAAPAPRFLFVSSNDPPSITYIWFALPTARRMWHIDMCSAGHVHEYPPHYSQESAQLFSNGKRWFACVISSQGPPALGVSSRHTKLQKIAWDTSGKYLVENKIFFLEWETFFFLSISQGILLTSTNSVCLSHLAAAGSTLQWIIHIQLENRWQSNHSLGMGLRL